MQWIIKFVKNSISKGNSDQSEKYANKLKIKSIYRASYRDQKSMETS